MNNLISAFIKAQSEMNNARLDSKNPHFKSEYASLESVLDAIKPILNKHGIAIFQPMVEVNDRPFIKTILYHESGESIESLTPVIFEKQTAQAMGSGISYARRYALQSLVCIGSDDDDANAATESHKTNEKPQERRVNSNTNTSPYVVRFGPDKGKTFDELGVSAISSKMAQLKFSKADFAKTDMAKEFLKNADDWLKGNQDPLDKALSQKDDFMNEQDPDWGDK